MCQYGLDKPITTKCYFDPAERDSIQNSDTEKAQIGKSRKDINLNNTQEQGELVFQLSLSNTQLSPANADKGKKQSQENTIKQRQKESQYIIMSSGRKQVKGSQWMIK